MITVIPKSGLCNRMRAIDSALSLSQATSRELSIVWIRNKILNCKFCDLFKPIDGITIVESKLRPFLYSNRKIQNFGLPSLARKIMNLTLIDKHQLLELKKDSKVLADYVAKTKHAIIANNKRFYPSKFEYQQFVPTDALQLRIEKETEKFNPSTIGVHIRRTDHKQAKEKSPLHLFKKALEDAIGENPLANFYLASDCPETKEHLLGKFGEKVITNNSKAVRDSKEGMQQALVELYALSKTQKVFGSYGSSFSETACQISGIPEVTIVKEG